MVHKKTSPQFGNGAQLPEHIALYSGLVEQVNDLTNQVSGLIGSKISINQEYSDLQDRVEILETRQRSFEKQLNGHNLSALLQAYITSEKEKVLRRETK